MSDRDSYVRGDAVKSDTKRAGQIIGAVVVAMLLLPFAAVLLGLSYRLFRMVAGI